MEASFVGAEIELSDLPIWSALKNVAGKNQWDIFEIAAGGGEDYCLLVTIDQNKYKELNEKFTREFSKNLTKIGVITELTKDLVFTLNGKKVNGLKHGFDHFR
jgi:thiamine-monophosphate kinase